MPLQQYRSIWRYLSQSDLHFMVRAWIRHLYHLEKQADRAQCVLRALGLVMSWGRYAWYELHRTCHGSQDGMDHGENEKR